MSLDSPNCTNTDISGIGVRSATYTQNLISFIPAIVALANDGKISNNEHTFIEEQSTNILLTAFGLLISALIQASTAQGLDNYHLALVLNLSWMNNTNLFIYLLLRLHRKLWQAPPRLPDPWSWWKVCMLLLHTSDHKPTAKASVAMPNTALKVRTLAPKAWSLLRRVDTATFIGSLHLSLMGALGVWLWFDPAHFSISDTCLPGATMTVLGDTSLICAVLVPIANLLLPMALILVPYFVCMSLPWGNLRSREHAGVVCIGFGLAILFVINVIFLVDTEVSISWNEARQAGQDNIWTLRQTLALLLLLLPMKALTQYIFASIGLPFLAGEKMATALKGFRSYEKHSKTPWGEVRRWMFTIDDTPIRVDDKWLEAAAEANQLDLMQFCFQNGADTSSVLHTVATNGHENAVRALIELGADINASDLCGWGADWWNIEDSLGSTLMHRAAEQGHGNVVLALIELGADINARSDLLTDLGKLVKNWAAAQGLEDLVCTLIELGADINARAQGHENVVSTLTKFGADTNQRGGDPGHENVVRALIELGAGINASGEWLTDLCGLGADWWNIQAALGLTPMHYAALEGHENVVCALIKLGADINARGHENVVHTLFELGGDINAKAAAQGHENVVRTLFELGGDINAKVAAEGHENVVRTLAEFGGDINARGHENVVRTLFELGGDINAKAAAQGHENVVHTLTEFGADTNARDGAVEPHPPKPIQYKNRLERGPDFSLLFTEWATRGRENEESSQRRQGVSPDEDEGSTRRRGKNT
ncbi:ankyrin repeat-containing domain protein [Mycena metata]|uniref:Ankyrin repeat-containing domain protein n=1 Tax=Mycena metata TaxID=1033252 RepID=A0AAD7I0U7_9AGAR|nr:ankyrin repeat-containing domain protein [Mycena metata]